MLNYDDLWKYATARVNNKSVPMRVAHSPKLHALRSALSSKGSAASKGAAVVTMLFRLGISAIPAPSIATSLINVAQQAVEKHVRALLHQKRLDSASDEVDKVKFRLKTLSVEELDRYRWKLKEAMEQMSQKGSGIDGVFTAKQKERKPCDAWLDLAEAIAQAERRYNILSGSAGGLKTAMDEALAWSNKQSTVITGYKNDVGKKFADVIQNETAEAEKLEKAKKGDAATFLQARHLNCSSFCYQKSLPADENAQWTAIKVKLAEVTKLVADPIGVEMFLATSADPYTTPEPEPKA